MVIAIQLADTPGALVHLVESDTRKCAFLREVARQTGAPAVVLPVRVETEEVQNITPVDAVTARAFAPLPELLNSAKVFLEKGAIGIFPRGRSVESQIAELPKGLPFHIERHISKVDPAAAILVVTHENGESPSLPR